MKTLKIKKKLTLNTSGIYYLRYYGKVVYIGFSSCILSAIKKHEKDGEKIFNHYSWITLKGSPKQILYLKSKEIEKFKPKYNFSKQKQKSVFLTLGHKRIN